MVGEHFALLDWICYSFTVSDHHHSTVEWAIMYLSATTTINVVVLRQKMRLQSWPVVVNTLFYLSGVNLIFYSLSILCSFHCKC